MLCKALLVKHKYGHTQSTQTCIWMSNMNDARHNIKERVRESGLNANTEICFEVRAHSSTSPPSHRRISINSSTQDFPHREPPPRIWDNYNLEYTTHLSNKYNLSLEARYKANTRSTSQMRDRHKAKQPQSPHTWGIPTQPPLSSLTRRIPTQSPLTRGISQIKEGLQLGSFHNHKQIFSLK